MTEIARTVEALAGHLRPGMLVAVPPDYSGVAMALTRALLRAGAGGLDLLAVPTSGIQADLLIGAGRVRTLEAAAVTLGELGPAPRFVDAVTGGRLTMRDSTCPAIHAGLQAAEKGVPFMPLRGLIGSDLARHRADWRVIDNPLPEAGREGPDPIVLLPALRPDVAIFHASHADRAGNVWIGRRRELVTMAHAARRTLVTVERLVDEDLLADEATAAGTLPGLYVGAVAVTPSGAWPLGLPGGYDADTDHLATYARLARSAEGFDSYLREHVLERPAA